MLPDDYAERKALPITTGVVDYFPDALAEVARVSRIGNDQHNPGQPLHWEKGKSTDHADSLLRHLIQRGTIDVDGTRHSAKVAWRALALLQTEIEAEQEEDEGAYISSADMLHMAQQDLECLKRGEQDDEPGAAGGSTGAEEVGPSSDGEAEAPVAGVGSRDCPLCDAGGLHTLGYQVGYHAEFADPDFD